MLIENCFILSPATMRPTCRMFRNGRHIDSVGKPWLKPTGQILMTSQICSLALTRVLGPHNKPKSMQPAFADTQLESSRTFFVLVYDSYRCDVYFHRTVGQSSVIYYFLYHYSNYFYSSACLGNEYRCHSCVILSKSSSLKSCCPIQSDDPELHERAT